MTNTRESVKEIRKRRGKRKRYFLRYFLYFCFVIILLSGGALISAYYYFTYDLPQLFTLDDYNPPLITKVLSDDGTLLAEFSKERRVLKPYSSIPRRLVQAFVDAEDADFFSHPGIDLSGIIRAFIKNMRAGRIVQGGSTITQQVTRSLMLSPEKSYVRKIREIILAYRLENRLTKEQILYLYLNQIYLGHGAYGIEAAANAYFDKSVEELNLAETAMLAGLPQAPSRYSPYSNPSLAKERQMYVLNRMVEEGHISTLEATRAMNMTVDVVRDKQQPFSISPYFSEHVRRYLDQKYGTEKLLTGGFRVYTTLNAVMQKAAQEAVHEGLLALDKRIGYRGPLSNVPAEEREIFCNNLQPEDLSEDAVVTGMVTRVDRKSRKVRVCLGKAEGIIALKDMQWARKPNPEIASDYGRIKDPAKALSPGDAILVRIKKPLKETGLYELALEQNSEGQSSILCIDAESGHVKAMVGGKDFNESQFNRATQAKRQPGSAFKPIIYAAAFEKGYTPVSIFIDSPIVFDIPGQGKWKPKNYEKKFYGPTLLRTALIRSRNVVTVKLMQDVGIDYVIEYARRLGITDDLIANLSLSLGTSDVTLLELVRAYSAFCSGGYLVEPIFITKVIDRKGTVLEENNPSKKLVISPETAAIMTNLLQEVVQNGTGWRIKALKRPAAGKTGTTNDLKDAWFLGYTPEYVTGVWVGFDDGRPMGRYETGSRAASPIWLKFMEEALKGKPVKSFTIPDGVIFTKIDPESGKLAPPDAKNAVFECFRAGTEPTDQIVNEEIEDDETPLDFFKTDLEASSNL